MRLSNPRLLGVAVALALALAFGVGVWAKQQHAQGVAPATLPRVTWDYRVVTEPAPASGSALSAAGSDGWELVAVISQDQYSGNVRQTHVYYYFKRVRQTY
jgi:hypothetical protein